MKRLVSVVLALLLIVAALPMTALAAGAKANKTMYIPVRGGFGQVYLRKGPGMSYGVYSKVVKHGDVVTPKGETSGEWSKVKVKRTGLTGWVKTMYFDGTTRELSDGWRNVKLKKGGSLKLRKGAGTGYAVKDYVKYGDTVKVHQFQEGWVYVTVDRTGITGWILQKYIGKKASDEAPVVTPPTSDAQEVRHVTAKSGLHLRKSPNGTIIKTLSTNTGLRVIGSSGNWYKVKTFDGITGYVFKTYTAAKADGKTTASSLVLRKGPSQSSGKVCSMPYGSYVKIEKAVGNWAYVTYGSKKGYASLTYIKVTGY